MLTLIILIDDNNESEMAIGPYYPTYRSVPTRDLSGSIGGGLSKA